MRTRANLCIYLVVVVVVVVVVVASACLGRAGSPVELGKNRCLHINPSLTTK